MKKILIMAAVALMGCMVSCNKEGGNESKGYTLSVDKSEVTVGETVTFSVTSPEGEDVSADFQVCECSVGTCYAGMEVIMQEAGEFEFEAHRLSDQQACENTVTVKVNPAE